MNNAFDEYNEDNLMPENNTGANPLTPTICIIALIVSE
jgi:hypothetical protein